ncbi:hypothetical protein L2E82_37952 [Cichorium intybus]|uniref:Uncharacterized protein n=1 Tax=Cichorium intybus TaxID=13427 RepID=A0ACB9AFM2_CICIN|nr:hypothetical protein L2E82_37952 [Cichorium intybus]
MVAVSATTKLFHTIDCERSKEGFSAGRPFPFKVEPYQHIRILTSVHGLHGLHLMKNGNMLIYGDHDLYELDMMTRSKVLWSYTNEKMLVWPGGKYIETLVSPNHYNEVINAPPCS